MSGLIQQNGQQPPQHSSMNFGSKQTVPTGPDPELLAQLSNVTRRLRLIEETVSNQRKKITLDEENNLSEIKKLHMNVKTIFTELDALKKENASFKEEMRKMIREFQTVAKKDDVAVLQKYIKLWEPVQFATYNQVQRMIADAVSDISQITPQSQSFTTPEFESPIASSVSDEVIPEEVVSEKTEPKSLFDGGDTQLDADFRVESVDENTETELAEEQNDVQEEAQHIREPIDRFKKNTRSDEIFSPHDSHGTFSQYTGAPGGAAPIIPINVTAKNVDTSAEDASAASTVSPEQKKQIAILIETYEDIRNMILHQPDAFIAKVETEPKLSRLFRGVNIKELSEKLRPHYS